MDSKINSFSVLFFWKNFFAQKSFPDTLISALQNPTKIQLQFRFLIPLLFFLLTSSAVEISRSSLTVGQMFRIFILKLYLQGNFDDSADSQWYLESFIWFTMVPWIFYLIHSGSLNLLSDSQWYFESFIWFTMVPWIFYLIHNGSLNLLSDSQWYLESFIWFTMVPWIFYLIHNGTLNLLSDSQWFLESFIWFTMFIVEEIVVSKRTIFGQSF